MKIKIPDNLCTGCGLCFSICPKNAIDIKISGNGFIKPVINREKCIKCHLCERYCPQKNHLNSKEIIASYAIQSKKKDVLLKCTSGGAAYELAYKLLDDGFYVYGCSLDVKTLICKHILIKSKGELDLLVGSKYMPSFFLNRHTIFEKGRKYAIFGLPCQIAAFLNYITVKKLNRNSFLLIELFCFGTPSRNLTLSYLFYNRLVNPIEIKYRSKFYGWHSYTFNFKNEKEIYYSDQLRDNDEFYYFFKSRKAFNDCCYMCKYKTKNSSADIKLGDFWGTKFQNNKDGVSLSLAYTESGNYYLKQCDVSFLAFNESDFNNAISYQMDRNTKKGYFTHGLFLLLLKYKKIGIALFIAKINYGLTKITKLFISLFTILNGRKADNND